MHYRKLPDDPSAFVLGIVSVVIVVLGCCCGLFAPISLTLGIIGLIQSEKSLKVYRAEPGAFFESSRNNMNTAKILSVIGIVGSAVMTIGYILYFAIVGQLFTLGMFDKYMDRQSHRNNYIIHDTVYKQTADSIYVDSIGVEVEPEKEN